MALTLRPCAREYIHGPKDGAPLGGDADYWRRLGIAKPSQSIVYDVDPKVSHAYKSGKYLGKEETQLGPEAQPDED